MNLTEQIYRQIDKISRERCLNADTAEDLYFTLSCYLLDNDMQDKNTPNDE